MKAIGYCRRADGEVGSRRADTKALRDQIKGYALLRGLSLDRCFIELPAHAAKPFLRRRRAGKMLELMNEGDVLIAPALEHIFSSATDAVTSIEHLREAGIELHFASWGDDILKRPRCDDVWPLLQYLAQAEERIGRKRPAAPRAAQSKAQRRGRIPFGYSLEDGRRRKNPEEQEAIRHMESLKAQGLSYAGIANEIESRLGYSFSHMGIKKILERQRETNEANAEMERG